MKQYLRNFARFFSSSTPRTIGLLLVVATLGITTTLLTAQPQNIKSRISSTRETATRAIINQETIDLAALEAKQKAILMKESTSEGKSLQPSNLITVNSLQATAAPNLSGPAITTCGEITSSGNYQLSQDLENNAGYEYQDPMGPQKVCLYIHDVDNVNLDCQDHKIETKLVPWNTPIVMIDVRNFTIKNCNLISDFSTLRLQTVSNGKVQNNTFSNLTQNQSVSGIVSVKTSNVMEISGNTFHTQYRQGPDDPYTAPFLDTSSINIHDNSFSMKAGVPISINNGKNNTFSNNSVDGMWDGSIKIGTADQVGADDGPVFANQENLTVSNNSISNTWDCGIETTLLIKNSSFTNNKITNAGYCGIGAWWYSSWLNNTVSGNIVNKSSYLFSFYYLRTTDIHEQNIYFQNNTFTNNKFSNRLNSSYMGDTQAYSSVFDYQTLINYGISPSIVKIGDNTFKNNDFDKTLDSPLMIPQGIAVDEGGNICKKADEDSHPLRCASGIPSPTPTPTPPAVTPTPTGIISDVTDCGTENQDFPFPPVTPTPVFTRIQCMVDKASACSPAKIILNQTLDLASLVDVKISSVSYQNISKNSSNTCSLHIKQGTLDFLRYGGTNEQKQAALLELKKREGLEGTCIFQNNADVVAYFNKLKSGVLSVSSDPTADENMFKNGQCSGPFFDQMSPSPTETTVPSPSSSSNTAVALDILLPGIGGDPWLGANINPLHQTRTFTIQFVDNTGKTVKEIDTPLVFTNESYKGIVPVADIPAGRYIIKIKTSNSLYKALPGVKQLISGQITTTPQITLITGNLDDTNGSKNLLDLSDYNLMISSYGHGNNLDLTLSDLNDDGVTESKDLNILLRGFATRKGD